MDVVSTKNTKRCRVGNNLLVLSRWSLESFVEKVQVWLATKAFYENFWNVSDGGLKHLNKNAICFPKFSENFILALKVYFQYRFILVKLGIIWALLKFRNKGPQAVGTASFTSIGTTSFISSWNYLVRKRLVLPNSQPVGIALIHSTFKRFSFSAIWYCRIQWIHN